MGKKAEKEPVAPSWECMKGKTVHALCEAGARKLLRCEEECSMLEIGSCSGPVHIGGGEPLSVLEAARMALKALSESKSRRSRRVETLGMIDQLKDDIMAARKAGHGWHKIATGMRGAGISTSENSLRALFDRKETKETKGRR